MSSASETVQYLQAAQAHCAELLSFTGAITGKIGDIDETLGVAIGGTEWQVTLAQSSMLVTTSMVDVNRAVAILDGAIATAIRHFQGI